MKGISLIRIRITLRMTSQNVWNMSLFEHFFLIIWILTQKIVYQIWILDPDLDFVLIPDPEVKEKGTGFRSRYTAIHIPGAR